MKLLSLKSLEQLKKGRHYLETFYTHFIKYPYSPLLAQVVVTRRCNLQCGYCSEYDRSSPLVPAEDLERTIAKLKALKLYGITFTGGEPTLHPELPRLIRVASEQLPHVSLITNGFLLTRGMIEQFNDAGLARLQISLDGIEPTEVTQKVLKNTEKKIDLLSQHARFDVHINAVLGSIPFEETLGILRYVRGSGLETTVQWLHDQRGHILNPYGIGGKEIKLLAKEANLPFFFSKSVSQVGINAEKPWKCRAGSRYLYIDEFSTANFCAHARERWQCRVEELNQEIFRKNFYRYKPCNVGCTLGCVRNVSRYDVFRR